MLGVGVERWGDSDPATGTVDLGATKPRDEDLGVVSAVGSEIVPCGQPSVAR